MISVSIETSLRAGCVTGYKMIPDEDQFLKSTLKRRILTWVSLVNLVQIAIFERVLLELEVVKLDFYLKYHCHTPTTYFILVFNYSTLFDKETPKNYIQDSCAVSRSA